MTLWPLLPINVPSSNSMRENSRTGDEGQEPWAAGHCLPWRRRGPVPGRKRRSGYPHVLPALAVFSPQLHMTRFIHWETSATVRIMTFVSLAQHRAEHATLLPGQTSAQCHHPFLASSKPSRRVSEPSVACTFCSSPMSQVLTGTPEVNQPASAEAPQFNGSQFNVQ